MPKVVPNATNEVQLSVGYKVNDPDQCGKVDLR
jgi:hypothetical protein